MNINTSKEHLDSVKFFFILGRPRSGTTLLSTLIDAHPNAVLPYESSLIINLFSKYRNVQYWTREKILEFYEDLKDQRKFGSWPVDLETLKENLLKCEGEFSFKNIIKLVYLHFDSLFDKENIITVGDKNPVYAFYSKTLIKIFPEAKFIHLLRDYRDNILSIKKVDFEAPVTTLLSYRWKVANKKIYNTSQRYKENFLTVYYEKLVNEPESQINEIFSFLGIDNDRNVLEFYNRKEELLKRFSPEEVNKYHGSLFNPISNDKVGKWKSDLGEKHIRIADNILGDFAEISGYDRRYKGFNLFLFLYSFPWIIYGKLALITRYKVDMLPYRLKMYLRNKGPMLAYLYNKLLNKK